MWDLAEAKLTDALNAFTDKVGSKWELNPGDGAFYGPKIDIALFDALRREFQCGTIQLDFNLPKRFKLRYKVGKDEVVSEEASNDPELPAGYARPVMIHRAVLGSVERMIGVLTEHFGGKWPFWLSPRQILVVPVMPALNEYAEELQGIYKAKGLHIDVDLSTNTFQKKIRTGQLEQYNFIFGKSHIRSDMEPVGANLIAKSWEPRRPRPARSISVIVTTRLRRPRESWCPSTRRLRSC